MADAAAAASDAVLDSSVLATFDVVPSSPGAGWSHFRLEAFGGSAEDILSSVEVAEISNCLLRFVCVLTLTIHKPGIDTKNARSHCYSTFHIVQNHKETYPIAGNKSLCIISLLNCYLRMTFFLSALTVFG